MKILQVITSLHTGGAEKLVVEFVPRLQKKKDMRSLLLYLMAKRLL